jgi:hypothetical protein
MTIARMLRGAVLRMRIKNDNSKDAESSSVKNYAIKVAMHVPGMMIQNDNSKDAERSNSKDTKRSSVKNRIKNDD